ncbi:hypothetical protein H257_14922 [Aphanomyces astaci]|uniref:Uncharacterized protein n=1 Tax=Aphanomyces astaci TaxID=112090 RepID=W4FP96_APHAT|nr:hypothetical protein H257_14922 [Aphanomyces astaci]ETV69295.1 hypothetical protein H257_14922 [Aphanomyces astaci]|eukprot:XP_009841152.1 hypothetical protein H257_14922 [Aphanomyces astaci]
MLDLYLALKDGAWLHAEDPDVYAFSHLPSHSSNVLVTVDDRRTMTATKKLSMYYSGGVVYPRFREDDTIHVVVVVAIPSPLPNDEKVAVALPLPEEFQYDLSKIPVDTCVDTSALSAALEPLG